MIRCARGPRRSTALLGSCLLLVAQFSLACSRESIPLVDGGGAERNKIGPGDLAPVAPDPRRDLPGPADGKAPDLRLADHKVKPPDQKLPDAGTSAVKTLAKVLGFSDLRGIAVDDQYVYWTSFVAMANAPTIMATDKSGIYPTYVTLEQVPQWTSSSIYPIGIASDGKAIYWAHALSANFQGGRIRKGGFGSGGPFDLATLQDHPYAVVVDGSKNIFWLNLNSVMAYDPVAKNGKKLADSVTPPGLWHPFALAVDDTHVYWAEPGSGLVRKVKQDGTGLQTIASGQTQVHGIAVDPSASGFAYFTMLGASTDQGAVRRVAKTGGPVADVISPETLPMGIAVDQGQVYWSRWESAPHTGAVRKRAIAGGSPQNVAAQLSKPYSIAVDATQVYWVDIKEGTVHAAPK